MKSYRIVFLDKSGDVAADVTALGPAGLDAKRIFALVIKFVPLPESAVLATVLDADTLQVLGVVEKFDADDPRAAKPAEPLADNLPKPAADLMARILATMPQSSRVH